MRVATYTQRTAATRASLVAIGLLIVTILQGTSTTLTLIYHFQKSLEPVSALLWLASYLVAVVGLMFTQGINWIFWLSRYRFLLVILLMGTVASIFWSIDGDVTTLRTLHLVGSCIIAIYIGFMVPLATTLTVLSWVLGLIILASVAAVFTLPALGIENYEGSQVWRGVTTSKNTLGFWSSIAVLLYISQWSRSISLAGKLLCLVMVLVSLATLYFSHSATSLLSLVVGGSIALYFFIANRFELGFVRMVVMAVLFIALMALAILNINTAELIGRSGDLTGRGEVWSQTWKLILHKPLTGYGYGAIWNPNESTIWIQQSLTDFTWIVYHAHNGFLQVASEIGLPLSCIALLMVVQQLIEIFYCQYQRQQLGVLFVLGFVIAYLVSNYSEARFLVNRELYWILFLALPISMLRQVTLVVDDAPVDDGNDSPASDEMPAVQPKRQADRKMQGAGAAVSRDESGVQRRIKKEALKNRVKSIDPENDKQAPLGARHGASQPQGIDPAELDQVFSQKPGEGNILDADDYFDRFAGDSDPLSDDRYDMINSSDLDFGEEPGGPPATGQSSRSGKRKSKPDIDLSSDSNEVRRKR